VSSSHHLGPFEQYGRAVRRTDCAIEPPPMSETCPFYSSAYFILGIVGFDSSDRDLPPDIEIEGNCVSFYHCFCSTRCGSRRLCRRESRTGSWHSPNSGENRERTESIREIGFEISCPAAMPASLRRRRAGEGSNCVHGMSANSGKTLFMF
jgi:hypothetical protein